MPEMSTEEKTMIAIMKPWGGTCALCGQKTGKTQMTDHLKTCLESEAVKSAGKPVKLSHLVVEGRYQPEYWLHLDVPASASLEVLDTFLRSIWLECCGHLSAFTIEGERYASQPTDDDPGWSRKEQSMRCKLGKVLYPGMTFFHEYDFGTTTHLSLKVVGEREGVLVKRRVRLLARNDPPTISCVSCGKPATLVCAICHHSGDAWFCKECASRHECEGAGEAFHPVVNSPRTGLCGYMG